MELSSKCWRLMRSAGDAGGPCWRGGGSRRRRLVGPKDEDDLEPLCRERAQGVVVASSSAHDTDRSRARPLALGQLLEGERLDRVAQVHVAGEAELHDASCLPLRSVTGKCRHAPGNAGTSASGRRRLRVRVEPGHRRPAFCPGQRGGPSAGRHAREKIGDGLAVGVHGVDRHRQLLEQGAEQAASTRSTWAGTGSCRRWRTSQFARALGAQPCAGPPLPRPLRQGSERRRGGVVAQEGRAHSLFRSSHTSRARG